MGLGDELGFRNPIGDPAHEVLLNVLVTSELLAKEGDHFLRTFGVTESQFNVLMLLAYQAEGGALDQTSLGRMLVVNRANVTGLVDRMEKAGWVRRIPDPQDRRVKQVGLTPNGRKIIRATEKPYLKRVAELVERLTPEERETLCRLLQRLRGGLQAARSLDKR